MVTFCQSMPTGAAASHFFCGLGHSRLSAPKFNSFGHLHIAMYADGDQLESCSRDPIGYLDGLNLFQVQFALDDVDPSGEIAITCECGCTGIGMGSGGTFYVDADCPGLASTCCESTCDAASDFGSRCSWTGAWKVVPGRDSYDDARDNLNQSLCEIALCCVPVPGGAAAGAASRLCFRGAIIMTRHGHAIVRIVSPSGRVFYRHMPGQSFVGRPMTCRGVDYYLRDVSWWGRLFPEIPLRDPLGPSSTICSPNCVWTAIRGIGNGL